MTQLLVDVKIGHLVKSGVWASFISKESAPTAVESYIICEKNLGNKSVILRENNKKEIKTDRQTNKNRDYHNKKETPSKI